MLDLVCRIDCIV